MQSDARKQLVESWQYENETLTPETEDKIITYKQTHAQPYNIKQFYEHIFNRPFIRTCDVGVGFCEFISRGPDMMSCEHVGMSWKKLNVDELQKLYEFSIGKDYNIRMMCYMMYEYIHPSEDGNGRMGRLLFDVKADEEKEKMFQNPGFIE